MKLGVQGPKQQQEHLVLGTRELCTHLGRLGDNDVFGWFKNCLYAMGWRSVSCGTLRHCVHVYTELFNHRSVWIGHLPGYLVWVPRELVSCFKVSQITKFPQSVEETHTLNMILNLTSK